MYDQVVSIALTVQNLMDDIACINERLYAVATWRDPVASALLLILLAVSTLLVYLLGLPLLLAVAIVYVLRPPGLRDPEPVPPDCYFMRLPAVSHAALRGGGAGG